MKKIFSIVIVFLMIMAMLHLTFASHYCCGHLTAFKLSFTGKLATCGMVECADNDFPSMGTHLSTDCCKDHVTLDAIDSNYTPSFTFAPALYQNDLPVFNLPLRLPDRPFSDLASFYTNESLPDALISTNVDLSDICVFRI